MSGTLLNNNNSKGIAHLIDQKIPSLEPDQNPQMPRDYGSTEKRRHIFHVDDGQDPVAPPPSLSHDSCLQTVFDDDIETEDRALDLLDDSPKSRGLGEGTKSFVPPGNKSHSEKRLNTLGQNFDIMPFAPKKLLDFQAHEALLKRLGLWDFVQMDLNQKIRVDLIQELIVSYKPRAPWYKRSCVNGYYIKVSRAAFAHALHLPAKRYKHVDNAALEGGSDIFSDEEVSFVETVVESWLILRQDVFEGVNEISKFTRYFKAKRLDMVDWAGMVWFMVERELLQGVNLGNCYYAPHLQVLLKHQKPRLFDDVAKNEGCGNEGYSVNDMGAIEDMAMWKGHEMSSGKTELSEKDPEQCSEVGKSGGGEEENMTLAIMKCGMNFWEGEMLEKMAEFDAELKKESFAVVVGNLKMEDSSNLDRQETETEWAIDHDLRCDRSRNVFLKKHNGRSDMNYVDVVDNLFMANLNGMGKNELEYCDQKISVDVMHGKLDVGTISEGSVEKQNALEEWHGYIRCGNDDGVEGGHVDDMEDKASNFEQKSFNFEWSKHENVLELNLPSSGLENNKREDMVMDENYDKEEPQGCGTDDVRAADVDDLRKETMEYVQATSGFGNGKDGTHLALKVLNEELDDGKMDVLDYSGGLGSDIAPCDSSEEKVEKDLNQLENIFAIDAALKKGFGVDTKESYYNTVECCPAAHVAQLIDSKNVPCLPITDDRPFVGPLTSGSDALMKEIASSSLEKEAKQKNACNKDMPLKPLVSEFDTSVYLRCPAKNNNQLKRNIDDVNDCYQKFLDKPLQRISSCSTGGDDELQDLNFCTQQLEFWVGRMKNAMRKEYWASHNMLLEKLEEKDKAIKYYQDLIDTERLKKKKEIDRYERELSLLQNLFHDYRKALKESNTTFAKYRKRCRISEEPIYIDVPGGGGTMTSIAELKRQFPIPDAEYKINRATLETKINNFQFEWLGKFEGHLLELDLLGNKLMEFNKKFKMLKVEISKA